MFGKCSTKSDDTLWLDIFGDALKCLSALLKLMGLVDEYERMGGGDRMVYIESFHAAIILSLLSTLPDVRSAMMGAARRYDFIMKSLFHKLAHFARNSFSPFLPFAGFRHTEVDICPVTLSSRKCRRT